MMQLEREHIAALETILEIHETVESQDGTSGENPVHIAPQIHGLTPPPPPSTPDRQFEFINTFSIDFEDAYRFMRDNRAGTIVWASDTESEEHSQDENVGVDEGTEISRAQSGYEEMLTIYRPQTQPIHPMSEEFIREFEIIMTPLCWAASGSTSEPTETLQEPSTNDGNVPDGVVVRVTAVMDDEELERSDPLPVNVFDHTGTPDTATELLQNAVHGNI